MGRTSIHPASSSTDSTASGLSPRLRTEFVKLGQSIEHIAGKTERYASKCMENEGNADIKPCFPSTPKTSAFSPFSWTCQVPLCWMASWTRGMRSGMWLQYYFIEVKHYAIPDMTIIQLWNSRQTVQPSFGVRGSTGVGLHSGWGVFHHVLQGVSVHYVDYCKPTGWHQELVTALYIYIYIVICSFICLCIHWIIYQFVCLFMYLCIYFRISIYLFIYIVLICVY